MAGKVVAYEIKVLGQEEAIRNAEDLKRVQKAIADEIKRADFGSTKYRELAQEQGKVRAVSKQMRDEVKRAQNEFVASGKAAGVAAGSYKALQAQLKALEDEYFSLGDTAEDTARKLDLQDEIKGLRDRVKEIRSEVGRDGIEGAFSRALGGVRGQFTELTNFIKGGFIVGAIQQAGQAISQFIGQSVEAFNTQAQAEQALLVALRGREDVQQRLLQQASEFQGRTLFGDEEIIQAQAFAVSMGLAEDQLGGVIQAAADLSSVTGGTLEDGIKNIVRTFGGLSGELGELVPGIRELSAEQLKAGEAVNVLNEAFGGQAEAAAQVGTGPITQFKNNLGDLGEVIGGLIVRAINPFLEGLNNLVSFLQGATADIPGFFTPIIEAVSNLRKQFNNNRFIQEYGEIVQTYVVGVLRLAVNVIAEAINNIARIGSFFNQAASSSTIFGQAIRNVVDNVLGLLRAISRIPDVLSGVVRAYGEFGEVVKDVFNNALSGQTSSFREAGQRIADAFREGYNNEINQGGFDEPNIFSDDLEAYWKSINQEAEPAARRLQDLTTRQTELQNKIKEAILNGQDYSQELSELRSIQRELNTVQETYNRLLGEEQVAATGSIAALQARAQELRNQINETGVGDVRLLSLTQDLSDIEQQIEQRQAQIDALKSDLSGAQQAGGLTFDENFFEQQKKNEEELRNLRAAAQEQYLAKQQEITDTNIRQIETRREREVNAILQTTQDREQAARQIADVEAQAELEILNERLRLAEVGSLEYLEITRQRIELERELEFDRIEQVRQKELEARQLITNSIGQISQAAFDIQSQNIDQNLNKQLEAIDEEYAARINAAEGNAELQAQLEEEQKQKEQQLEKEAAERRRQIAITEAIIQTALSVIEASPDPVRMTAAAIAGAIQLATIQAQTFATGGFTGFSSAAPDHTGQRPVGIVHEKEYVVPTKVLQSKQGAAHVRALEALRQRFGYPGAGSGIPAFASGGLTSQVAIPDSAFGSLEVVVRLQPEDDFGTMIAEAVQQGAANGSQTGIRSGIREADREREARETLKRKTS
jgi:hypothetical protein